MPDSIRKPPLPQLPVRPSGPRGAAGGDYDDGVGLWVQSGPWSVTGGPQRPPSRRNRDRAPPPCRYPTSPIPHALTAQPDPDRVTRIIRTRPGRGPCWPGSVPGGRPDPDRVTGMPRRDSERVAAGKTPDQEITFHTKRLWSMGPPLDSESTHTQSRCQGVPVRGRGDDSGSGCLGFGGGGSGSLGDGGSARSACERAAGGANPLAEAAFRLQHPDRRRRRGRLQFVTLSRLARAGGGPALDSGARLRLRGGCSCEGVAAPAGPSGSPRSWAEEGRTGREAACCCEQ